MKNLFPILILFLALAVPGFAQQPASKFSGTVWVSEPDAEGTIATMRFEKDGKGHKRWKKHGEGPWRRSEGTWRALPDDTGVDAIDKKGHPWHYKLTADHHLQMEGGLLYAQTTAGKDTEETTAGATEAPPAAEHTVATVKLPPEEAAAVVLIEGDNSKGTGFLVKTATGPVVVTNQHVISNNPHLKITTSAGASLTLLSYQGATDRDLAEIAIQDGAYSYLSLAPHVDGTVQPGDEVVTPGNSEGGDVVLNTDGKILGIGPERVEFDNPIYHGNSGGPVLDMKTKQVVGVVTEAMKVVPTDDLDKASFANRNSAIGHSMRYFGLRLDTVPGWQKYDWDRFQLETKFLEDFHTRSAAIDSFLNAPDDNKPEDRAWVNDYQVVKANNDFLDSSRDTDAGNQLVSALTDLARTNMESIQTPANFYAFDEVRTKDEIAYRKALIAELEAIEQNRSRMQSLPRTNR